LGFKYTRVKAVSNGRGAAGRWTALSQTDLAGGRIVSGTDHRYGVVQSHRSVVQSC